MREEKIKEYIELVDRIIYGVEGAKLGMLDCIDPYYKGSWEYRLLKLEELKIEING